MDERSEQHAVDELDAAAEYRRQADKEMSMSERLAALHELCKQLAAVDGTAKPR
jgi:hypothetical protein